MSNSKKLQIALPIIFSLVLIAGMFIGIQFDRINNYQSQSPNKGFDKLNNVLRYINTKYVDTLNSKAITEAAINGILKELDPHSSYIPPSDLKAVNESLNGEFSGIGIEFYIVKDTIMVVSPISGGPSESLGILSGDKIVKIEGENVGGIHISNNDVINKLRGKKGTIVNISILRSGESSLIDYEITRDNIPLLSIDVAYKITDDIGYIKINRFAKNTYREFMKHLDELVQANIKSLIVDLRNNPGGFLTAATNIADEFIAGHKIIVYTEGNAIPRREYISKKDGMFEKGALVILIDEGSASASEILAGALQDWDRATIIGKRSFGKGLVQEQYEMPDRSALRLTIARYYTPTGRCIQRPYNKGTDNIGYYLKKYDSTNTDSIQYKTPAGKILYGGGGITPDITVERDTIGITNYLKHLYYKGIIPQFVYDYYAKNKSTFSHYKSVQTFNSQFNISNNVLNRFVQFADSKGVKNNPRELAISKSIIKTQLKAYIAKQIFKEKGFYPIMQQLDNTLIEAVKYLDDKKAN